MIVIRIFYFALLQPQRTTPGHRKEKKKEREVGEKVNRKRVMRVMLGYISKTFTHLVYHILSRRFPSL